MIDKNKEIKTRIFNSIMKNGKKRTGEKILLKSLKEIQKRSMKKTSNIISIAIKHTTPTLKLDHQKLKKKKRKTVQEIPTFIKNNFLRVNLSIKSIIINSKNNNTATTFSLKLANEFLNSTKLKSSSVEQVIEMQKQILSKRNVFFKYRWKK